MDKVKRAVIGTIRTAFMVLFVLPYAFVCYFAATHEKEDSQ